MSKSNKSPPGIMKVAALLNFCRGDRRIVLELQSDIGDESYEQPVAVLHGPVSNLQVSQEGRTTIVKIDSVGVDYLIPNDRAVREKLRGSHRSNPKAPLTLG